MDEEQQRDRLTRLEERFGGVERGFLALQEMIRDLGQELRAAYVPRGEHEERSRAHSERVGRLESRLRDAEELLQQLQAKPAPKPEEPGWVKVLIALVSILGGALVTLIITLAIYYQARP